MYFISKIELKNQLPVPIPLDFKGVETPEDISKFKDNISSWCIIDFPSSEDTTS